MGDLREQVGGALRTLNAEQREVLEPRIVRELGYPQIARRVGDQRADGARPRLARPARVAAALDAADGAA